MIPIELWDVSLVTWAFNSRINIVLMSSPPPKKELWCWPDVRDNILNQRVSRSSGGVSVGDAFVVTVLVMISVRACVSVHAFVSK